MKFRQTINLLTTAIIATVLTTSCGGNKNKEVEVKPSTEKVYGDLEDYISVVDGTYKISNVGNDLRLMIKLKVNKAIEEGKEFDEIKAELLDDGGLPLSGVGTFRISKGLWAAADDNTKVDQALKKGSGEVVVQLVYSTFGAASDEEALSIASDKAKKFSVTTKVKDKEAESSVSSSDNSTSATSDESVSESGSSVSESGSEDWDKMLDDYDEYVSEYIKFYKKAMKGDNSALAEYPAMMEKATKLEESMTAAQNDNKLSATQIARMMKIQTKMLQAASTN